MVVLQTDTLRANSMQSIMLTGALFLYYYLNKYACHIVHMFHCTSSVAYI